MELYQLNRWRPGNADHTYATTQNDLNYFIRHKQYRYEGIEGYVFPKSCSQPSGTVKLMRKYNPNLEDHAIFPETMLRSMLNKGYTQNTGTDWLGYVYPM